MLVSFEPVLCSRIMNAYNHPDSALGSISQHCPLFLINNWAQAIQSAQARLEDAFERALERSISRDLCVLCPFNKSIYKWQSMRDDQKQMIPLLTVHSIFQFIFHPTDTFPLYIKAGLTPFIT